MITARSMRTIINVGSVASIATAILLIVTDGFDIHVLAVGLIVLLVGGLVFASKAASRIAAMAREDVSVR